MRLTLRRPLDPHNIAPELARTLARILKSHAEIASAAAVIVTIEEPAPRAELRMHIEKESFGRMLDWHLAEMLGGSRVPPALHVHYGQGGGETHELSIEPASARAASARLDWGSSAFEVDGTKPLLAVGRGPIRKRFPGARNDVVIEDHFTFVSRDAFALRWDPGRNIWRLEVDEVGRAFVEIRRAGSTLIPQLSSIPLQYGDVIALTGGPDSPERLEMRFTNSEPTSQLALRASEVR